MEKALILDYIRHTVARSQVKILWVLGHIGLAESTYYRWCQKQSTGSLEDTVVTPHNLDSPLPEERQAAIDYALQHPEDGYRRLAFMMLDDDVCYLSPSALYRILCSEDLLYRYKRSTKSPGRYDFTPKKPHEQWHTDILYLWVHSCWYFFVAVLDAFSRYIVHWQLLESASAQDVRAVLQSALKMYKGEHPRIVSDHGPQFISKEFRELIKEFSLKDIKIRIRHPESNGVIERFHRSLREEALREQQLGDKYQAMEVIGQWVEHYNHVRLHAALGYLRPHDYLLGVQEQKREIRKQKLKTAVKKRRELNRKLYEQRSSNEQLPNTQPLDLSLLATTV